MPLDATIGGASSNAYCDASRAQLYFDTRLNTAAWDAAIAATRDKALMAATARLEQERYVGYKASSAQALAWPRQYVEDKDGSLYASSAMPTPVVAAVCELALHLLNGGTTDVLVPSALEQFDAVSVGPLDITPRKDAPAAGSLPPQVVRCLAGLFAIPPGVTRLARA